MFTSLKRIIKSGWKSFFRDRGLAAATVFILVLAISLATSLFLFRGVSQFIISLIEQKADISVYFKQEVFVPEEEILKIKDELAKIPEVKEIEYISHEEAVKKFLERYPEERSPHITRGVKETGGVLNLASLNIKAAEAAQYAAIAKFLETAPFKNLIDVDYYPRKPLIERIFSLTSTLNRAFLLFSIILAAAAILITFNTIRLAIYNSGEEIKIQRLVGASNWFIRGPFLVQGVISGVIAGLICLLIFSLMSRGLSLKIETFFPGLNIFQFFVSNFWTIVLIQFATGIFLGVVSSFLATRRYLKA